MPSLLDRILDASVVGGFSRVGHRLRARAWAPLPGLDGRVCLVTGATGGIGRAAARGLAALGARVLIVGRRREAADAVREELAASTGAPVVAHVADLSLLREVRALAERVLESEPAIHVLVNNVGVLHPRRRVTEEGIEATLATNLLGQFVLTNLLIPRLVESAPARIISVSSGGMYAERIRPEDLQSEGRYRGSVAYARTKRGQVILTEMWAERLSGTGVVAHAMHPGWVDTPGVRSSLPRFRALTRPVLRTPEQGADTILWLAAAEEPARTTGLFWHDRVPRTTHRLARTREPPADRERLWAELERLSGPGA